MWVVTSAHPCQRSERVLREQRSLRTPGYRFTMRVWIDCVAKKGRALYHELPA